MTRAVGRALAVDLLVLFGAKAALGAYVLAVGFTHVSDDDFARVVIAEEFAHHPALDPSGTSWLPFPFWLYGVAMLVLGRSLAVARGTAFVLGVTSVAAPYLAMRFGGVARGTALLGTAIAMALPWSAWLGVSTVPEAMTACLVAAAAILAGAPRGRLAGAAALVACALSRYEAWPACAVFAAACLLGRPPRALVAAALACAAPLGWMAWNAHAHGSALHFLARVAAYRQSIGAASAPLTEKLWAFPRALVETSPVVVAASTVGGLALLFEPEIRVRWRWPLATAAAILAFLVYGDVRDGAPTHHPERALLPVAWILVLFSADAIHAMVRRFAWGRPSREMWVIGVAAAALLAGIARLPQHWRDHPAASPDEAREAQVARGLQLAETGATRVTLTPCAYEHFALIAAFARPERVETRSPTRAPVTAECPRLEVTPAATAAAAGSGEALSVPEGGALP